ncbi:hypothetical protein HYU13_05020 [Candidatus Woesearchaeota archaeon]|nr:hypothetical protein [Candidatus Woesearchaeota archaeon]
MDTALEEYTSLMVAGGYKPLGKSVFRFGKGGKQLLERISCNTLDKTRNALLDRFGKLIILFDQLVLGDEVYVVFEGGFKGRFLESVEKYAKLAKVALEEMPLKVLHVFGAHSIGKINIAMPMGYLALADRLDIIQGIREISGETYTILRLENNMPVQGIDFDQQMFLEIAREDELSFTKGCYPGQEVIARVRNLSRPGRKLVRIAYQSLPGKVTIDGSEVGKITSSGFSYKFGSFLAFAVITNYDLPVDGGEYV